MRLLQQLEWPPRGNILCAMVSDMLEVALDAVFGKSFAAIWKDAQCFAEVACGAVVEGEAG